MPKANYQHNVHLTEDEERRLVAVSGADGTAFIKAATMRALEAAESAAQKARAEGLGVSAPKQAIPHASEAPARARRRTP